MAKILDQLKSLLRLSRKNGSIGDSNSYYEKKEQDKKLVFGMAKGRVPSFRQWKYLRKSLSDKERFIVRASLVVFIAALVFLGMRFYQRHVYFVPEDGGKYVEAAVGAPKYVNPIFSQTNDVDQDLTRLIYSSLMKYDEKGQLVTDLVENYEISEDQKVYTFTIKQDVKFHDGEILNVNDILFTIESIQDPEIKSPLYLNLKGVETEKVDDKTFKLTLKEPFSPFLSTLNFGILPQHLYNDVPPENITLVEYNLKPIGTGPFKFKTLTRDSFGNIKVYTLERNEDYYGKKPYLDNLIFRFYPDTVMAVEALKNKNVEGISYLPKEYEEELPQKIAINYYHLKLPQYIATFFNTKNDVLKDKNVRLALAYSADRERIFKEVLKERGEIIDGPILEGHLGYHPEIERRNYNPEEAAKLLEEAEWKMNEEGTARVKGETELRFTLTTIDQQGYWQAAEILKESWKKIGINVDINIIETERVQKEAIKPRNYDAILYGEIIGYDPDPYPFWHSSQQRDPGLNLAIYYNKQVDKVLEQARKTADLNERTLKYVEFQNLLTEEMPSIFLYRPDYTYGLAKKVKGFDLSRIVNPQDRFTNVENWYINTKRAWK